ncbi:MAG TPA: ABC transporter permease [Vicinamibacterales bacterium]|jgi:putative ABC transport system permease protein|nr:ABC transporter permease [Vicinamibacterales bacterium]
MESFARDLRYAVRSLSRARGFIAVAVLTLALGIGANTTMFGMVNAVLLRPLAFDHPEQLVKIWGRISKEQILQNWLSEPEFWDLRDGLQTVSALAVFTGGAGANLTRGGADAARVTINQASADLLPMLGVRPIFGRTFTADEDHPGGSNVAVLDYGFWKSQFGGDTNIVGRTIQLDGETCTVVGVLPEGFTFGGDANLWTPLALDRTNPANRGSHYLEAVARLKPGVTAAQASADLDALAHQLAARYPQFYLPDSGFGMYMRPLQEDLVGRSRTGLVVLFAAVGFVLIIACINLANLLLARGSSRSREIAVRAALGAGRLRLVRQLVTESLVVALAGGASGVLLAVFATEAIRNSAVVALPNTAPITIDVRVLIFATAVSLVTGVLFGLIPALRASRAIDGEGLKDAARGSSGSSGQRLRSGLVVAEIALAVVLLVSAGLTVRSLAHVLAVSPGFNPAGLLTARVSLPQATYPDVRATTAFYASLEDRLRALPGVESAGLTTLLPMTGRNSSGSTFIDRTRVTGLTVAPLVQRPYIEADRRTVTPSFFKAMEIPLRTGRYIAPSDTAEAPLVIVVDEAFAQRIWPGQDPLGQRLSINAVPKTNPPVLQWRTVVGVVAHVKHNALDQLGREQIYVPLAQTAFAIQSMYLAVRPHGGELVEPSTVQRAVHTLDPALPLYQVKPMAAWVDATVAGRRFNMLLLVVFGALALGLAAVGTYGVLAYSVGQRTREIAIRMALGAPRREVMAMILSGGLRLAVAGLLIGAALAVAAGRLISSLLFAVPAADPLTFAVVALVLLATAAGATWLPARRATRIEPIAALRTS